MTKRLCAKGHPITGWNRRWKVSRGKRYPACRLCFNAYQKHLMRKRRKEG